MQIKTLSWRKNCSIKHALKWYHLFILYNSHNKAYNNASANNHPRILGPHISKLNFISSRYANRLFSALKTSTVLFLNVSFFTLSDCFKYCNCCTGCDLCNPGDIFFSCKDRRELLMYQTVRFYYWFCCNRSLFTMQLQFLNFLT